MYSAIQREDYSAIYRFSAVMTELVDPAALQRAIDRTMPRFPSFRVRIHRGAFWYYFEPNDARAPLSRRICRTPANQCAIGRTTAGWSAFSITITGFPWRYSTPCPTGRGR